MTTGAHEVTTVDDFNIRVCWEVMVEEPELNIDFQVSYENYVTSRHIHLLASVPVLVGQYQNLPKFITTVVLPLW